MKTKFKKGVRVVLCVPGYDGIHGVITKMDKFNEAAWVDLDPNGETCAKCSLNQLELEDKKMKTNLKVGDYVICTINKWRGTFGIIVAINEKTKKAIVNFINDRGHEYVKTEENIPLDKLLLDPHYKPENRNPITDAIDSMPDEYLDCLLGDAKAKVIIIENNLLDKEAKLDQFTRELIKDKTQLRYFRAIVKYVESKLKK